MKTEEVSIEAKIVAQLEEQLTYLEREILQRLQEPTTHQQPTDSHHEGVFP